MKKLVLSTFLILQVILGFAQSKTGFTGKVVESKSQKPMQNAVVSIQNTAYMQITNAEGKFTFNELAKETYLVLVKSSGYKDQLLSVDVIEGKIIDLGVVVMEEDITQEQQLSLVTITDNDLGDDNSGSETTSGLLQASRDVIQQTAAFNWGQARFKLRGLNNEYSTTMINGLVMNKMYDGRPQWSNWGGLNDATRNQEFTMGSAPSDYTFGNILGTQEINTRASIYRPGARISASGTNTNYNGRIMGTFASGMNNKGWAYVVSASRRWSEEGPFEGTNYSAYSVFASVEKKFGKKHSLNFTSIYAQNKRGKTSPNTEEVNNLKGHEYNSYWGWQDGEKRNSRIKNINEPINILSHYWKISKKTNLNTNVSYQTGHIGNSRIDYQLANNPDPTYYKNLPSYYINEGGTQAQIDLARNNFVANGQMDWNAMYYANTIANNGNGRSVYALYEDRNQDNTFTANSILDAQLSDNIIVNAAINYKNLRSRNSQRMLDLLGGDYFLDIDPFYVGDASQSDLNNPNREVAVGEDYGYKYDLNATNYDGFAQFKFTYKKVDFYLGQNYSRTEYQREGLYKNGIYASNSYGKSEKLTFENFGFKGGLTYKITGRHFLDFNGAYYTKAPFLRNVFYNARLNNNVTPELQSETVASVDASYVIRTPKFKGRVTGFLSTIKNATEVAFFYGESLFEDSDNGNGDSFISEITTNIDKRQMGIEAGFEYNLTSTIKVTGAATYGRYVFSNNPNLYVNDDGQASASNTQPVYSFGQTYLKNYKLSGTPQQAYSIGVEYRDPHFWWIGVNANYLADNYLDISNILRTNNFSINDATGVNYSGLTDELLASSLKQERFRDIKLLNATGGKSWKVKNTTFGFFASVNNILDLKYKTGGFEQSRKATYPDYAADHANGTPSFGSKYFYGYGRSYFVNLYVNF